MTLIVALSPEAEAALRRRAAAAGIDPNTYVAGILEDVFTKPTVDEILAPFRQQVADSGMGDDQLDRFYEELRDETWGGCRMGSCMG